MARASPLPVSQALGADEFSISLDEGVSVIDDYMPAMPELVRARVRFRVRLT